MQLAQQDTNLMSDFQKKRREAMERSKLAKEKGNNISKLIAYKKRLATGAGSSHAAVVAQTMPDAKKQKAQASPQPYTYHRIYYACLCTRACSNNQLAFAVIK